MVKTARERTQEPLKNTDREGPMHRARTQEHLGRKQFKGGNVSTRQIATKRKESEKAQLKGRRKKKKKKKEEKVKHRRNPLVDKAQRTHLRASLRRKGKKKIRRKKADRGTRVPGAKQLMALEDGS